MVQGRITTLPLVYAAASLLLLGLVSPLFWGNFTTYNPDVSSSDVANPTALVTTLPPELNQFAEADETAYEVSSPSGSGTDCQPFLQAQSEKEVVYVEPTEPQWAAVSDRLASHVVAPEASESVKAEQTGPRLTAENVPRESAAAPSEKQEAAAKPSEGHSEQNSLLPPWVRRLPALVANVRVPSNSYLFGNGQTLGEFKYPETSNTPDPLPSREEKSLKAEHKQAERKQAERKQNDYWPEPTTLIECLQELSGNGPASQWADEALRHVQALGPAIESRSDEAAAIVRRLDDLERRAHQLAAKISDKALARTVRRAGYALARRIDVWEQVVRLGPSRIDGAAAIKLDPKKLLRCLAEIDAATGDSAEGRAWRKYLMVGPIKESLTLGAKPDEAQLRRLARRVLVRLAQTPLTPEQQKFVSGGPVTALQRELRRWAAEPVSIAALLRDVERYERTGLPSDAHRLAMSCQYLLASPEKDWRELAARVDFHYRNANFRLAVTEELINNLIPEQNLEYARVSDTVLDHPTRGESLMATEAVVQMQPDRKRVRMTLEVTGEIAAVTTTDAGLARFHNNSESYYVARKPLEVDLGGISLWPSEVYVRNETRLRGVDTSMDGVPLLGPLFKGVARSQLEQKKPAANREVRRKVAARARERIDAEVHKQFAGVVERLNQRVFDPLNSLTLDPKLIEAETTEKRFTMRLRLAGDDQLGSHTPRPRASSDSLASVQLHETALNNGIQRLQLANRTFTLAELADHVAARLNCPPPWKTNAENEDVRITFAGKNPVVVRCRDGKVVLTLSIRRLVKSPRTWNDFQIRAFYRPEVSGRTAQLVREGVIYLIGDRLTVGSQITLRGVFSHVLSKDTPLKIVDNPALNNKKLQDAEITQFVIEDGWIGISLGPKTSLAGRQRSSDR